jgi:hypothetical protein
MNVKLIAATSIGINLVLAALLARQCLPRETTGESAGSSAASASAVNPSSPAEPSRAVAASKFEWRSLESEDYKTYIANLRTIGCPEDTIQDIISADIRKNFEAREKSAPPAKRFEYWKTASYYNVIDEDKLTRKRQSRKERNALLKELLGRDIPEKIDPTGGINPFELLLDFLPLEKQAALAEIEQRYGARLNKAMATTSHGDFTATKTTLAAKNAEVAQVLTPGEKFEYDLRLSQSASMMRMRLGDIEVSEAEYRELYKQQRRFDDQFGLPGMQSNDRSPERDAAQKQLNQAYKTILGDDRLRELLYGMDYEASGLKVVAEENNIPKATALKVFDVVENAQNEAFALRQDRSMNSAQRREALNKIRASVDQQIGALLGPGAPAFLQKNPWARSLGMPESTRTPTP